jgi:hypothetical protein
MKKRSMFTKRSRTTHYWFLARSCQEWIQNNHPDIFKKIKEIANREFPLLINPKQRSGKNQELYKTAGKMK